MKLPVLAWSPLGAGFAAKRAPRAYDNETNRARLARAAALAETRGVSLAQIALAYVLCQPFPTFAITAARSVERMQQNLAAADIALTPSELRGLEGV